MAAVSGAALSFSYTGFYLSIYSWVCVGVLVIVLFGARPLVAFGCGFLHGLCFVLTSVPWIAKVLAVHGGLSIAGGWGILLLDRDGMGRGERSGDLGDPPSFASQHHARVHRRAFPVGFAGNVSNTPAGD